MPALNGATRVGRCFLEGLAKRNHECRVIALVGSPTAELKQFESLNQNDGPALTVLDHSSSNQVFVRNGVKVYAFANGAQLHEHLKDHIREFDPTWIIISEDPTYMLLAAATEADSQRTLFLSQSQATLPFGPESFLTDPFKKQMLEEVSGLLTTSEYLKSYFQRWGGLESFVTSVPLYGGPPFPHLGSIENSYVTIINPSNIKGLPIFLELARRFPEVMFAAVPTWATSAADRCALESLSNVKVLKPSENVDDIFRKTRVLLVPSLWGEALGLVVIEAMLRGIPVLASNVGGLVEAKLGVDYILPVNRIEKYEHHRDEIGIPIPVIPLQNVEPWDAALEKVLNDQAEFERISIDSRKVAVNYVLGLSMGPTEKFLENLSHRRPLSTMSDRWQRNNLSKLVNGLPAEKLAVLMAHLKKNAQRN
jgi:glycosyltransferase involved in cell wall biosynthesis